MGAIGSGSPIQARTSTLPYTVILFAIIAIGLLFLLWLFLRLVEKYKQSEAHIKKQRDRVTNLSDVQALAKKIDLTREEAQLLFRLCHKEKARNIYYSWTDEELIDTMFKNEYIRLKENNGTPQEICTLFNLRSRIERIYIISKTFSSTANIPVGESLDFAVFGGIQFSFKIVKNEKEYLTLQVPPDFEGKDYCPKPLSKISVTYLSPQNLKYTIPTRVIRYQNGFDNSREMVIQHSSALSMQSRRHHKRASVGVNCLFSAVEETKDKKGKTKYIPKENKYEGKLMDISAGGCMITTKLPIKKSQKIWLRIDLPDYEPIECCGMIVGMRQNMDLFSLHIVFVKIPDKYKNEIFSYVYKYE